MANDHTPLQRHGIRADELQRHAAFVRGLARRLVRDPHGRDDLVQETWLSTIRSPPAGDRPVRPWLARVLTNGWRRRHRTESRRRRREYQAARPEHVRSTAGDAAHAEIIQRMVAALMALPEPLQTAVILRFYEELPPRMIAKRTDAPVETVKSRIKRGLDALRRELDRSSPGGRTEWLAALMPLGLGADAQGVSMLGGAVVVKKVLLAGVVVVALLLSAVLLFDLGLVPSGSAPEPSLRGSAGANAETPLHEAGRGLTLTGTPSADVRDVAPVPAPAPAPAPGSARDEPPRTAAGAEFSRAERKALETQTDRNVIEGIIYAGRHPIDGGTVRGWPRGHAASRAAREPGFTVPVDAEGTFRISDLADGRHLLELTLGARQPRLIHLDLRAKRTHNRRIVIQLGTASIKGRVYDASGAPRAGETVMVSGTSGRTSVSVEARIANDGSFEVGALAAGNYWVQSTPPHTPNHQVHAWMKQVLLAAGETGEIVLGPDPSHGIWEGRVLGSGGRTILESGTIQLLRLAKDGSESGKPHFVGYEDGRFRAPIPAGRYRIRVSPPGFERERVEIEELLEMGAENVRRDIEIPGARIDGRVKRQETGEALTGYRSFRVYFDPVDATEHSKREVVRLDTRGIFRLDGLAPGSYVISGHPLELVDNRGAPLRVSVRGEEDVLALELFARKKQK